MKNRAILLLSLPALLALQGCSSMLSLGEPEYTCPGLPAGSSCRSVIENYEYAEGSLDDFRKKIESKQMNSQAIQEAPKKTPGYDHSSDTGSSSLIEPAVKNAFESFKESDEVVIVNNPFAPKSVPVVSSPRVYSVWFAPRIGKDGRFYAEHNVYFIKGSSQWKNSEKYIYDAAGIDIGKPKTFKPLQVMKAKKRNSQAPATQSMGQATDLFK